MNFKSKAYYILIGFFCCIATPTSGQNQKLADSLTKIYQENKLTDTAKLELLRNLSFHEGKNIQLSLRYSDELIRLSEKTGNDLYLYRGYLQKGNSERLLGNWEAALAAYFKSGEIAHKIHFISGEGNAYGVIADVYSLNHNHTNAMRYYNKAISTLRIANDSIGLASIISNAGDEFLTNKNYDSALLYFKESGIIFDKIKYLTGKAYNLGNIGMVYANIGENNQAEKNINESIRILEELEDYYPICVYLIYMSDIYLEKGDLQTALNYAQKSLTLAKRFRLKEQIADADLKLSELYEKLGDNGKSLQYYKNYILYRDSVNNINTVQKMADLRTNFEVSEKQIEVDLLREQKKNLHLIQIGSVLIFTIITAGLLFWIWQKKKSNRKLTLINETISEINASKDKFFSIISHDLKGPLNSLTGFSGLLLHHADALTTEEIKMLSLDLDKSLKNLSTLLDNLLQWSLSQTGHIDFNPEPFDIALVLKENQTLLKDVAQRKKITIVNESDFSMMVYANYNSINTVVRNLMSNAIKFTPEGGTVSLHAEQKGKQVCVFVNDTGLGINEHVIQKLFKIDSKHSTLGTDKEKGTGLGLIICKDFVEKNGGVLDVESKEGKGSSFYFTLPIA